jgi:hypothetical protein
MTMVAFFFLYIFSAGSAGTRFADMTAEQINSFLRQNRQVESDEGQRLLHVSEKFLRTPFVLSPLGEGPGAAVDADPLMRFDAVDCMTFVEETIALSIADNLESTLELLNRIRYWGGKMDYAHRKHLVMSQWIPMNTELGLLEDVTERMGGKSVRFLIKHLDPAQWREKKLKGRWPDLRKIEIQAGDFKLPVIPLERVLEVAPQIPSAVVVIVVRQQTDSIPDLVGHMGFIVQREGRTFLRHAASKGIRQVIDEPLASFVTRNRRNKKWPVEGFNLQKVLDMEGIERKTGGQQGS